MKSELCPWCQRDPRGHKHCSICRLINEPKPAEVVLRPAHGSTFPDALARWKTAARFLWRAGAMRGIDFAYTEVNGFDWRKFYPKEPFERSRPKAKP